MIRVDFGARGVAGSSAPCYFVGSVEQSSTPGMGREDPRYVKATTAKTGQSWLQHWRTDVWLQNAVALARARSAAAFHGHAVPDARAAATRFTAPVMSARDVLAAFVATADQRVASCDARASSSTCAAASGGGSAAEPEHVNDDERVSGLACPSSRANPNAVRWLRRWRA